MYMCVINVSFRTTESPTTMSNLPRLYFHLTIAATLILTISAQTSRGSGNGGATPSYDDFLATNERCSTRIAHQNRVRIDNDCEVIVSTKRCKGFCRSLTDFEISPPNLKRECACCQPYGDVKFSVKELDCFKLINDQDQKTGKKVKVAVPEDVDCRCVKCKRTRSG